MQAVHRVVGTLRPRCQQPDLACPPAIGPDGRADSDIHELPFNTTQRNAIRGRTVPLARAVRRLGRLEVRRPVYWRLLGL